MAYPTGISLGLLGTVAVRAAVPILMIHLTIQVRSRLEEPVSVTAPGILVVPKQKCLRGGPGLNLPQAPPESFTALASLLGQRRSPVRRLYRESATWVPYLSPMWPLRELTLI